MSVHEYLLKIYKQETFNRIIRALNIEVPLKDLYWWLRGRIHSHSTKRVDGYSATFESYSLPGSKEYPVVECLLSELKDDDVFYDVGSDRGWYTCFAATAMEEGHIVAFEPHPSRRKVLLRNLALNESDCSVVLREEALSNTSGTAEFGYRILNDAKGEFVANMERGDTVIRKQNLPAPNWIKSTLKARSRTYWKA